LNRAERVVALNPGDPRSVEMLAAAQDFLVEHSAARPPATGPAVDKVISTLREAAALAESAPQYFRDTADRAAFHRRVSFQLADCGDLTESLVQAERAAELEPDSAFTLTRLAHAHRALGQWGVARSYYERLMQRMPEDKRHQALRYTEYGDLLMEVYGQPELAIEQYRRAQATGVAPPRGVIGLARCEVLVGEGARGYELIRGVLDAAPENVEANLVLGMYYLRSHKWDEADFVYSKLLRQAPTLYPALIGYHEVCAQRGEWRAALAAWETAARLLPEERAFRCFLCWAMACADDPRAGPTAEKLLETDVSNAFACYSLMLIAARSSRWDEAMDLAREGSKGVPVPLARENARARATLRLMSDRGELPLEAVFVEAVLLSEAGDRAGARLMIETYLAEQPDSRFRDHAERLLEAEFSEPP
jgi:tetratricopeptide (TPR) repeat protein